MIVLIHTSVILLAFRRRDSAFMSPNELAIADSAKRLALMRRAFLIGMVRQESLMGLRSSQQIEKLKTVLDGFAYLPTEIANHDAAAECFNQCRAKGIAASDVDMLICATAIHHDAKILTVDHEFVRYARCLPVKLYGLP